MSVHTNFIIILSAGFWNFVYWHFDWYCITLVDHFMLCDHWLIVNDSCWTNFSWKCWTNLYSLYIGHWWHTKVKIPPKSNLVNQCVYWAYRSREKECLQECGLWVLIGVRVIQNICTTTKSHPMTDDDFLGTALWVILWDGIVN